MAEFKVPQARGLDGELVLPEGGCKGVQYNCPHCDSDLLFRKGEVRRPHFAHRSVTTTVCSPDKVEVSTAKQVIVNAVRNWRQGSGPAPSTCRRCVECGVNITQPLGKVVTSAASDYAIMAGQVRVIVDVALLSGERIVGLIGLRSSTSSRAEQFANVTLPWVELEARRVIRTPTTWHPVASGSTKDVRCKAGCTRPTGGMAQDALPTGATRKVKRPRRTKRTGSGVAISLDRSTIELLKRGERRRKRMLRFFAHRQGVLLPVDGYLEFLTRCDECHRWVLFFRPMPISSGTPRLQAPPGPARSKTTARG
ncbi:MAG: hypothetical protein AAB263_18290 [Planctomycetota bacterium]